MAGFFKKIFSFGKKEVIEKPVDDEPLAPINWDALKELRGEPLPVEARDTSAPAPVEPPPSQEPPAVDLPPELPDEPADELPPEPPTEAPAEPEVAPEPARPEEEPRFPEPPPPDLPTEAPPEPKPAPRPEPEAAPTPPEIPEREIQEPDLPVEIPPEPEPPAEAPPEPLPDLPTEVPPEPRPEPDVPPAPPEPDLPVEVPPEPEPPVEAPSERQPDLPPEVPPEPQPEPRPQPDVPPAPPEIPEPDLPAEVPPKPEAPPEPQPDLPTEVPPEPRPEPEVPPGPPEVPEREIPPPERAPQARPVPEAPIEVPQPPPPAQPAARGAAGGEEALAPINWEALKAFRRDEPEGPPATKVTVAKKVEQKAAPAAPPPEPRRSWYQRLREGLARSSRELSSNIAGVFTKRRLDEDTLQDLEDILLRADLGIETAIRVTDTLASGRYGKEISDTEVRAVMATEIEKVLTPVAQALELDLSHKPHVILVVGVNGTGKTTTIGKLAAKLKEGGLSVMLAAGDTFRAAAIEQLKIWGERTGSPVISSRLGADAAGLAYEAFEQAKAAGSDVLVIDTAGRLQNKAELMAELEKIVRVLGKLDPDAPHTVLQTVDATTGQNALNQVEIFRNVAGVNGLVMTKLDGTARGGILVAIAAKHKLPVYFIGVGEQVDDLEPFQAQDFARAIAGVG